MKAISLLTLMVLGFFLSLESFTRTNKIKWIQIQLWVKYKLPILLLCERAHLIFNKVISSFICLVKVFFIDSLGSVLYVLCIFFRGWLSVLIVYSYYCFFWVHKYFIRSFPSFNDRLEALSYLKLWIWVLYCWLLIFLFLLPKPLFTQNWEV